MFTERNDHVKGKYNLGGLALYNRIILKCVKLVSSFVYRNGPSFCLNTVSSLIF
jgi:hypothetical protein